MPPKKSKSQQPSSSRKSPLPDRKPNRPDRDRRVRQHARIARVLGVLQLLQSRGRWNAQAMAAELGCSERTIYRDLEVLEFAGIPWHYDEEAQCYRLTRPDYRFPTLSLSDEELVGQAVATVTTQSPGLKIGPGSAPTTRKLAATSNERVQQLLEDAEQVVSVLDLKIADHSQQQEIIQTVQQALLRKCQVTGHYESPYESGPVKLRLHPYRLCLIKSAWYLIGRPTEEQQPRTYRIARFKSLRMLDDHAEIPSDFSLKSYLGNAWGVYRGEQSFDVELWFNPQAAKIVTETIWHQTQKIVRQRDGSVILKFRVDGLEEIANWVLCWTGRCKVLEPRELRDRIVQTLEAGMELQQRGDSGV